MGLENYSQWLGEKNEEEFVSVVNDCVLWNLHILNCQNDHWLKELNKWVDNLVSLSIVALKRKILGAKWESAHWPGKNHKNIPALF